MVASRCFGQTKKNCESLQQQWRGSVALSAVIHAKVEDSFAAVDMVNAFIQTENQKLKLCHETHMMK